MKKRYSGPQIVAKLRQADVLLGQGKTVPEVCKEIEISQQRETSDPSSSPKSCAASSASAGNLTKKSL